MNVSGWYGVVIIITFCVAGREKNSAGKFVMASGGSAGDTDKKIAVFDLIYAIGRVEDRVREALGRCGRGGGAAERSGLVGNIRRLFPDVSSPAVAEIVRKATRLADEGRNKWVHSARVLMEKELYIFTGAKVEAEQLLRLIDDALTQPTQRPTKRAPPPPARRPRRAEPRRQPKQSPRPKNAVRILCKLGMKLVEAKKQVSEGEIDLSTQSDNVTDVSVMALAEHCPQLTNIYLDGCTLLTDVSVTALAEHCPGLRYIYLNGCHAENRVYHRHFQMDLQWSQSKVCSCLGVVADFPKNVQSLTYWMSPDTLDGVAQLPITTMSTGFGG